MTNDSTKRNKNKTKEKPTEIKTVLSLGLSYLFKLALVRKYQVHFRLVRPEGMSATGQRQLKKQLLEQT